MGEIKSTLEIIMEKTKGLTLTEHEKKAFKKKETEGKVKGLIMKFIDGLTDLNHTKKEIASIDEKQRRTAKEAVVKECLARIDPETDNILSLELLEHVAEVDTKPIQSLLSGFRNELDKKRNSREKKFQERMQKKGISGSAILPNLSADEEWAGIVLDAKKKFKEKMKGLIRQPV